MNEKREPPVCSDTEKLCVRAFRETGSWLDLLVLADWLKDYTDRTHYETILREMAAAANPATLWFARNLSGSYFPDFETPEQGLLRTSCEYAWIEGQYWGRLRLRNAGKWRFVWSIDHWATDDRNSRELVTEDEKAPLWHCSLEESRYENDTAYWHLLCSCGGIDLGDRLPAGTIYRHEDGDYDTLREEPAPYARIVQVQMARDTVLQEPLPDWMTAERRLRHEWCVLRLRRKESRRGNGTVVRRGREWGDLYAIMPTSPLITTPDLDHHDLCEAWYLNELGDAIETSVTYRGFARNSDPVPEGFAQTDLECLTLLNKLYEKGVVPMLNNQAPYKHLQTMRDRRDSIRRKTR